MFPKAEPSQDQKKNPEKYSKCAMEGLAVKPRKGDGAYPPWPFTASQFVLPPAEVGRCLCKFVEYALLGHFIFRDCQLSGTCSAVILQPHDYRGAG